MELERGLRTLLNVRAGKAFWAAHALRGLQQGDTLAPRSYWRETTILPALSARNRRDLLQRMGRAGLCEPLRGVGYGQSFRQGEQCYRITAAGLALVAKSPEGEEESKR